MSNAHHLTMLDVRHLILVVPILVAAYYISLWRSDKRYVRMAPSADRSAATLASAIRVHREQVEAAGTVDVVDSESRKIAQIKHRADERLWGYIK